MTDTLSTKLNNDEIPENYFAENCDSYIKESVDNNSYIILATLILIGGFVALAAFVLVNTR